ncbi:MAG: hypothetical protein IKX36_06465 [Prevotella sp.]|nr:hypothetical protein [Prevotella sp.]
MMKRIITIVLSAMLTVAVSAQERTPVDQIWEDISKIVPGARTDSKLKVNHGDGVLRYVQNGIVGKDFLCSTDCDGVTTSFEDMTPEEIEAANERNRKVFDAIFGTVRHHLDSLMDFSEESYHFESHSNGTDTITYSLCLKNSKESVRKYKADDGSMVYPDAAETVFFDFTASLKPCGKHVRGFGTLGYNKNVFLPNRQSHYFDRQSYLDNIMPILKHKDIKSWNFKWSQSADYDIESNYSQEFVIGEVVGNSGPKNTGQTIGTMYFIPREKTELAEAIFTSIDDITQQYTDIHPEQIFLYRYHLKEEVMQYTESNYITQLFEGTKNIGHLTTRVFFGITPEGYYVAVADVENNFCIPKEWYILKSFADGKKEYIKGVKK